jgi:hypothetical protein
MTNLRKILFGSFALVPLFVLTISCEVAADSLSDPTLPSSSWLAMQPDGLNSNIFTEMYSAPDLQMVLIGQSRKLVIIDGRIYKIGDRYNGSKILKIKSDEVVMHDASKSLKLTPAVEKRVVTSASQRNSKRMSSKIKIIVNKDGSQ